MVRVRSARIGSEQKLFVRFEQTDNVDEEKAYSLNHPKVRPLNMNFCQVGFRTSTGMLTPIFCTSVKVGTLVVRHLDALVMIQFS